MVTHPSTNPAQCYFLHQFRLITVLFLQTVKNNKAKIVEFGEIEWCDQQYKSCDKNHSYDLIECLTTNYQIRSNSKSSINYYRNLQFCMQHLINAWQMLSLIQLVEQRTLNTRTSWQQYRRVRGRFEDLIRRIKAASIHVVIGGKFEVKYRPLYCPCKQRIIMIIALQATFL